MGEVIRGILIPFLGTTLGASCVLFMKKMMNKMVQRALTGFAAGIMVSASVWSLLIPSMDYAAEMGKFAFVPAVVGFWIGILFLLAMDHIIPHLHMDTDKAEGPKSKLKKTTMLVFAVTLHNIPEEWLWVLCMQVILRGICKYRLWVRWLWRLVLQFRISRRGNYINAT